MLRLRSYHCIPSRFSFNKNKINLTRQYAGKPVERQRSLRTKQRNFAAEWQNKGGHYVSYQALQNLNSEMMEMSKNNHPMQKELELTYFARHHYIIREEYQYEKSTGKFYPLFIYS